MMIDKLPNININIEYIEYGTISTGDIFPNPAANNTCPPYGIIPCTAAEKISNKLAVFSRIYIIFF